MVVASLLNQYFKHWGKKEEKIKGVANWENLAGPYAGLVQLAGPPVLPVLTLKSVNLSTELERGSTGGPIGQTAMFIPFLKAFSITMFVSLDYLQPLL